MAGNADEIIRLKEKIEELQRQIEIRDIALNSTKILIRITDLQGTNLFINKDAHHALLGYSEKDRIGHSIFEVVHPDDREHVAGSMTFFLSHPEIKKYPPVEFRLLHKDGHYLWAMANATIIKENDRPHLMVMTTWDISERKQMEDQLHALAERLHTIREEERTLISREIHDEFGQALTSLKFELALLARKIPQDNLQAMQKAKAMMESIDGTIQLIRRISTELRPPILDDFGLKAAIEWQAEDFQKKIGIRTTFKSNLPDEIIIDKQKAISIFRIFQEALTNSARHASATLVTIHFDFKKRTLILRIKDNGKGITEDQINNKTSLGIMGMKERAFALNGKFSIKAAPYKGTLIELTIPIDELSKKTTLAPDLNQTQNDSQTAS